MEKEVLRMERVCYSENSIDVVRDGNFHMAKGEIVGLVGKNHAGKSTLLGAATGEYPCQLGDIWIEEKKKRISNIEQARKEGIFLIKDESSLIAEFTIRDTMRLNYAFAGQRMRYPAYINKCREMLALLDVQDNYDMEIQHLNFHKRVLIEIVQALVCDAKVLVFDNVVSLLSSTARAELDKVFQLLCRRGLGLVLIENQEDAIKGYLDRLCIMRKGGVAAELRKGEMEEGLIRSLIEGIPFVPRPRKPEVLKAMDDSRKVLEFSHICTEDRVLKELELSLYAGETLGVWNRNRHSGKAILDMLEGKLKIISGEILVNGKKCAGKREDWAVSQGIYTVPEEDEVFTNMTLGENISLAALKKNAYGGIVKKEGELRYLVQDLCGDYLMDKGYRLFPNQVVPDNILIRKKMSLCRAIAAGAEIIAYNNPYLKMDLRESELFDGDIIRTQKRGIAQIIISAHRESLYPVCNRILQIEEGRIVGEIRRHPGQEM